MEMLYTHALLNVKFLWRGNYGQSCTEPETNPLENEARTSASGTWSGTLPNYIRVFKNTILQEKTHKQVTLLAI